MQFLGYCEITLGQDILLFYHTLYLLSIVHLYWFIHSLPISVTGEKIRILNYQKCLYEIFLFKYFDAPFHLLEVIFQECTQKKKIYIRINWPVKKNKIILNDNCIYIHIYTASWNITACFHYMIVLYNPQVIIFYQTKELH